MDNSMIPAKGQRMDHEDRDVNVRAVLWFTIALTAVAIVVHLVLWLLFGILRKQEAPKDLPASMVQLGRTTAPPEPRLQYDPVKDLDEMRAAEQRVLDGYGWVDQGAGVVHIPIDQAIRLAVQKGTYVEQKAGAVVAVPAAVPAPGAGSSGAAGSGTQTQPPPQTSTGVALQGAAHP